MIAPNQSPSLSAAISARTGLGSVEAGSLPYGVAHVNVAVLGAPLDSPQVAPFLEGIPYVNDVADRSHGFIWLHQTHLYLREEIGPGNEVITTMSVWRDLRSLHTFVFGPEHAAYMRRRREWFLPMDVANTTCWWIPADQRPTEQDVRERLQSLRERGPTPFAFTFGRSFTLGEALSYDEEENNANPST